MNKKVKKEINFAGKQLVLETGDLAMQANLAVKASYGDTVVLATVVAAGANPEIDYFPLSVHYEEKLYASGTIKTSRFIKREGRPTDEATVTRRLIDHAIRSLFPDDFMDEVQVIVTVLSLDKASDPVFLSMVAASAALHASDIPFTGPVSSVRVGYFQNEYILNPTFEVQEQSDLDMVVSFVGEDKKFLACEAEVKALPDEIVLKAITFACDGLDPVVNLICDFAKEVNPKGEKYEYDSSALDPSLIKDVKDLAMGRIVEMLDKGFDKTKLRVAQDELMEEVFEKLEGKYKKADMAKAVSELEKHAVQHLIMVEGRRPDGRGIKEVRPVSCAVEVLPRTHGSAVFTRGVTQVLTVATLGSPSLEQLIHDMYGEKTKRFIHYYNFPPFSVGEVAKIGAPLSREIGHGMLAENALKAVIPDQKDFPYMILLMSETLSSSGSSSMASVCGSTLALMDAGVPIKDMVAGVGVGLMVSEDGKKQLVMTDLAYMEDAYGYLDFKMAGTKDGVTAIQSDMKLKGLSLDVLPEIFQQSKEARLKILEQMRKTIDKPKPSVSQYAPKMYTIQIDPDRIGVVIGAGGRTIKAIEEETGTTLTIEDDGKVVVSADGEESGQKAVEIVKNLTKKIKPGEEYEGTVAELAEYGAFVEILPGRVGLLHISEISDEFVKAVKDYLKVGDKVKVKVIGVSDDGKYSLSMRENPEPRRSGREGRSNRAPNRQRNAGRDTPRYGFGARR